MYRNFILRTDSYKLSHDPAYKKGIKNVYSYLESRGGKYPYVVFFGLQYYLKRYLEGRIITKGMIDEAEQICLKHFGRPDVFNRKGWETILNVHGGKLPIRIKAVPEGMIVPNSNILMDIEVTDEENDLKWLTNSIETLLMKVWYPITVATQSREIRRSILKTLEKTGTPASIDFKCHDFGYRGVTCEEQAELGAASHLLSFMGTDTLAGITMLQYYYGADMPGFSIPATEHSIMCSFGRNHEIEACENFLDTYPKGMIACVSDTYNIFDCCEYIWGKALKDKILSRDGVLVIRPDSGDFFDVIPRVLDILWKQFGGYEIKGYKVLNNHIRVIQGDGMNPETINDLYSHINRIGWSSDNLAVGSGGGLLMKDITRDTQKFAIKASAVKEANGEWVGIKKDPITDKGKTSKMGRLKLIIDSNGNLKTVNENEYGTNLLIPVFENGEILKEYNLEEIKQRMI
jgi:nicotinamide phosphoribosyltransferase